MDTTNTIEFQGITLPETTFADAEVGRDYVTVQGYKVTVVEVQPDSHAMVRTAKGKELRTKATATCFGPILVEDAAPAAPKEPARKKRGATVEELQAEFLAVVGRATGSTNVRYLRWKILEARKGRITVGAIERRPARPAGSQQVLPLTLERVTTSLLDAAVAASGAKSRSAFIRAALIDKLRAIGGDDADAAADAMATDAV